MSEDEEELGLSEVPEVDLIFTVPYTDFDLLEVEVGLHWLAKQVKQSHEQCLPNVPDEHIAMEAAYKVLIAVQHRYVETCGSPERAEPNLLHELHPLDYLV